MILKELKNKTIIKQFDKFILKNASNFDLLEYSNKDIFLQDIKYNENVIADFQINKSNIFIIYVYEF